MNRSGDIEPGRAAVTAYVAPVAAFLISGSLVGVAALRSHYPLLYTLQIGLAAAIWSRFREAYPSPSSRGLGAAVAFGVVGAVGWIGLCRLQLETRLAESLPDWIPTGERVAFDPFGEIADPASRYAFLAARLTGLVVVVPLIEEVFWRGFLARFLISEPFTSVPIGRFTPWSFGIVTVAFAVAHPEFVSAIAWGAGINALLIYTRNLWACIAAHAVTNLLLGIYVLYSGQWSLW